MNIKRLILGPLETNCYLIIKDGNCLIVDPAFDFEFIKKEINNLNLIGILITHYHFDHIGALEELKNYYNVPIYDYNSKGNINIENFSFDIIYNPGHTNDSITFYFKDDKIMFVGDFLFRESIGRTDLPTGNNNQMLESLKMIKKYSNEIIIYPGHGPKTNLGYEKNNNVYLNYWKINSFFSINLYYNLPLKNLNRYNNKGD